MSGNNEVKVVFAGDATSLETAANKGGTAFDTIATKTDKANERFGKFSETSDKIATKTGTLAGGIGAISGGLALLGVNSDSTAAKLIGGLSVAVGTLSGVMDILSIATEVMTGAQWAENLAFLASPITWIVLGIVALVAVIVLIATKTDWFQKAWSVAWDAIKVAAKAVADFFVQYIWHDGIEKVINWIKDGITLMVAAWKLEWQIVQDVAKAVADFFINTVWHDGIEKVFNFIGDGVNNVIGWFKDLPGKIGGFFSTIADNIKAPFRAAFNFVSDAWNNTIGRLSWTVPSWVPLIGGDSISAPKLPHFHSGGVVPGMPGQEVLAVLQAGERVIPASQASSGGDTYNITVNGSQFANGDSFDAWLSNLRNNRRRGLGMA